MTAPDQPPAVHFDFPSYQEPPQLSDTTRHLCGAAYIDLEFAETVIREVIEDERRAVAPSFGFDLNAVVRHCFRARHRYLVRDGILFGLLLLGLVIATFATVAWLILGITVLAARSPELRQLPPRVRLVLFGSLIAVLLCCGGGALFAPLMGGFPSLAGGPSGGGGFGGGETLIAARQSEFGDEVAVGVFGLLGLPAILLAIATLAVLTRFERTTHQILIDELRPGVTPILPSVPNERVARRLAMVARAQYGNITVQERDPFLGCGKAEHGWSYAIPVRHARARATGQADDTSATPIDQAELGSALTAHVRAAVRRMREDPLPPGARVPGLSLVPHIVADGVRHQGDPLLDPATGIPRSRASDEVIEAIIRHPQGGLRYYDRIVVSGAGKSLHTADGRLVLPEQRLGIDISAFVHVAVEGGLLYVEFVTTVMPPIQTRYALVDRLHPEQSTARIVRAVLPTMLTDSVLSGWRLARRLRHQWSMKTRMADALVASAQFRTHDYGARVSVRQLVAEPAAVKHLQLLDEWKYTKLLERAVLEAVVAFLTERGLDTADLVQRASEVQNIFGNVNNIFGGQQAFASSNVAFDQRN
ncbi:hypothetical protein V6V47_00665 [Micromonospora sp. CPCC 205539]|uniref:hypothetical protein n=1 Tax=Micromonospora sp. CPCC 205539 TaxID=3122408 RepID=UPI002FF1F139